jgi:tetratricopeptide (TPR) repeat protein
VNTGVTPGPDEADTGTSSGPQFEQRIFAESGASVYAVMHGDIHVINGHPAYRFEPFPLAPRSVDPVQARRQPSRLLAAENRVVPFSGRADELRRLATWRDDPSPGVSVMLLHGAGGQGKSRLAAQFAVESAERGWTIWAAHHVSDPTAELVVAPGETGQALVVVVEYAERWPADELQLLLQNPLLRRPQQARLLLVSRPAEGWWPALRHRLGKADIAVGATMELQPLAETEEERQSLFDSARDQFASALAVSSEAETVPQWPVGDGYELVLTLHMAALVAVDARSRSAALPADPVGLSAYLLDREYDYWQSLCDHDQGIITAPRVMARAVYTATLVRSQPHDVALAIVERIGIATGSAARDAIHNHALCYPPGDSGLVLEPLYPDRLGEDFVALQTPGHGIPDYAPDPWAATAPAHLLAPTGPADYEPPWLRPSLTVLIEIGRRWPHVVENQLAPLIAQHPRIALSAGGAALARLAGISGLSIQLLEAIELHLPSGRHVDLDVGAAAVVQRLAEGRLSATTEDAPRARLYERLGYRQQTVGEHGLALASFKEALGIYRRLAAIDPGTYRKDMSDSLQSISIALSDLGQHEQALANAEEAVEVFRQLSEKNLGSAYLADLASCLSLLSIYLSNVGRWDEALAPAEEAVGIYRSLADADADTYLPDLAYSLEGLGTRMLELARPDAAEELTSEAVALYRRLVNKDPDASLPGLSASLHNLGNELSDLGRIDEALACSQETVDIDRRLAAANPGAYMQELATSLINLSADLGSMGMYEEAITAAQESLSIRRRLAAGTPTAYLPNVASSACNLAIWLSCANRRDDALVPAEEALDIYRSLAKDNPAVYLSELVFALNSFSTRLSDLGRYEDALAAAQESVSISRQLVEENATAQLPLLARALECTALELSNTGRQDEAIPYAEEAVAILRRLAEDRADSFLPDLANALSVFGEILLETGSHDNALVALAEAIDIYRPLAQASPLAWDFNLAESLAILGAHLSSVRHHEDALTALDEAVGLYRSLAEISPAAGLPDLAKGLRFIAAALSYGRRRLSDAFDAIEEAIEIYVPLAEQWPLAFSSELASAKEIYTDVVNQLDLTTGAVEGSERLRRRNRPGSNPAADSPT